MTGNEWADYVEWSGLDEARLAEIMLDRQDGSSPGGDTHRDRYPGSDAVLGAVARSRRFTRRRRSSAAAGARHRGA